MNTSEINKALRGFKHYKGCFSCDLIPAPSIPSSFVINTDPSNQAGEHWVAMAFSKQGESFYFDSFGFPPFVPQIASYVNKYCKRGVIYNSQTLQHPDSSSCGLFCVDFISTLESGKSYQEFLMKYSRKLAQNEIVVKKG